MNSFQKDIFREITNTLGRFLGIFAIVALGVSFYAGLGATGPDMKLTGDLYFRAQNLMDLRVVSTFGLTDADITAIRETPGVRQVFASYSTDAMVELVDESLVLKLHALDTDTNPSEWINRPWLRNGRYPEKRDEILVEGGFLWRTGLSIGDTVTFISGKSADIRGALATDTFTIVGTAVTPMYMAHDRGSGSIGSGSVDAFAYIPADAFRMDVYTEAYITLTGAKELSAFSDEYENLLDMVTERLEDLGEVQSEIRLGELTNKAYASIRATQADLEEQSRLTAIQFADAEKQLTDAQKQLTAAKADTAAGRGDVSAQSQALQLAETQLFSGIHAIQDGIAAIAVQVNDLQNQLFALEETESALRTQEAELRQTELQIPLAYPDMTMRDYALAQVRDGLAQVSSGLLDAADGRRTLEDGLFTLSDTRANLEQQLDGLRRELASLQDGKAQLSQADATLGSAGLETLRAANTIRIQLSALAAQKAAADEQFTSALSALTAQLAILDDMDTPEWYVLERSANPGYQSFVEDTDKVQAIGRVFPLIFFIVAALVSLTTMTRLVEERRTEIGTLKSLGYSNGRIASKYLIYAIAPTLLGGLVGGYVGMKLFPALIIDAYNMLYTTPPPSVPIDMGYWVLSVGMAVACTVLAALFACLNELRAVPSQLMRPKAPKAGKRIIWERIPFLWRLFSFTYKVTIRNLTRYKKRFLMTVIGISGCTALLVTGFGLRDSISGIIGLQFGEINNYNMTVSFRDGAKSADLTNVSELLASDAHVKAQLFARQKTVDAGVDLNNTKMVNLVVPESAEVLENFVVFRDRKTYAPHVLTDDGVIITEKLSRETGLQVGDSIVINADDQVVSAPIRAITEHYFLHYVYMSPALYAQLFGEAAEMNSIFVISDDESKPVRNELAQLVLEENGVSGVGFTKTMEETFTDIIDSLDFVIIVLIVSAGALAFVVLLNLTNINISERVRELATIAVLGFTDSEISAYIYRENVILTFIGALAGLGLGVVLHGYILQTVETDMFMFGMQVATPSFVYSVILTFVFAAIVNMLTAGKLKKIDMVEALKSVE